jgi:thiosulfate/3-mercaptopyruvate sulfurtransferase
MSRSGPGRCRLGTGKPGQPNVVIVEVDGDATAYDKNHIRGAISWTRADLQDPVRRDFVNKAGFEKLLSERGISNADTVVLYGGTTTGSPRTRTGISSSTATTRQAARRWPQEVGARLAELVTEVPERATEYRATDQDRAIRRSATSARQHRRPQPDRRTLTTVRGPAAGPTAPPAGAVTAARPRTNRDQRAVEQGANDDGTFRSDDELRALTPRPVDFDRSTVAYCRIGERSSHTWFVLHELLGQPNVRNYDGS